MTFLKMFAATVLGLLTFSSPEVLAHRGRALTDEHVETRKSSAKCAVVAIGFTKEGNDKAIASAATNARKFICTGKNKVKKAKEIAEDTASSFALAVAAASAKCVLEGDASAHLSAHASATSTAEVWVAAYAAAFAAAGTCDECEAYAGSFGYVEKEVFLRAVADANIHLNEYSTAGNRLVFKVLDYQAEIKRVVAKAFATSLAAAAQIKDKEGCLAWANAGGCIYLPDHPDTVYPDCDAGFECKAVAVSVGEIEEYDAMARARARARTSACGDGFAIADAEATAQDLAEATAVAISFAFASCKVDHAYACAGSYTEIEQTAEAVAKAFARAWAKGKICGGKCKVSVDVVADVVGSVLVKAATDAYAGSCVSGTDSFTLADFEAKMVSESLCAIAEATALSVSHAPNTCAAVGIVKAEATDNVCPVPEY